MARRSRFAHRLWLASLLAVAAVTAPAWAASNTVKPMYGNIAPFYGHIDPFYGNITPFYGNIAPFYGNITPFWVVPHGVV